MRAMTLTMLLTGFACGGEPGLLDADAGTPPVVDAGHAPVDAGAHDGGSSRDLYAAGMTKPTAEAHFQVALLQSDPIPRDLTLYTWLVEVRDAQGQALDGASVVAEPTMPDHGHGTFPRLTQGVGNGQTGQFVLADMDLFMAGTWRIELQISRGDVSDTVQFHFDLDN
jgi:hypothetical protein